MITTIHQSIGRRHFDTSRYSFLLAIGLSAFLVMLMPAGAAEKTTSSGRKKARAKTSEADRNLALLTARATLFREAARKNLTGAGKMFDCAGPLKLIASRPMAKENPGAWPRFFAGSILLVGNAASDLPVAGYYNPFFDAVVLTTWQKDGKQYDLKGMAVRLGSDLAGDSENPVLARWLAGKDAGPLALGKQYKTFIKDFERSFPPLNGKNTALEPASQQARILDRLESHMQISQANLEAVHTGGGALIGKYMVAFKTVLVNGKSKALSAYLPKNNPVTASQMTALPLRLRETLSPQYCVLTNEKALIFANSSFWPTYYGIFEFATSSSRDQGTAKPERFSFFEMQNQKKI
ncbi:MAG: hypothetical protein PHV34_15140 [Verrucomicrobiae bacterium]|nr:hypothetical protein [Verrucomicrobiae bacterium]